MQKWYLKYSDWTWSAVHAELDHKRLCVLCDVSTWTPKTNLFHLTKHHALLCSNSVFVWNWIYFNKLISTKLFNITVAHFTLHLKQIHTYIHTLYFSGLLTGHWPIDYLQQNTTFSTHVHSTLMYFSVEKGFGLFNINILILRLAELLMMMSAST